MDSNAPPSKADDPGANAPRAKGAGGVDMEAHEGLRGLAAVHVMVFHCVLYSTAQVDIQGSSTMPLFFLLSGFALTAVYGSRPLEPEQCCWCLPCCCARPPPPPPGGAGDSSPKRLNAWAFYQNRIARVMPVFYLCNAVAVPLMFVGHSLPPFFFPGSVALTILPVSTFFGPPINFCGPSWTVCTLMVMWLHFPHLLPMAQRLTDEQLAFRIVVLHVVQVVVMFVLYGALFAVSGDLAFWVATAHPWSRLPVFMMGMYAAMLRLRGAQRQAHSQEEEEGGGGGGVAAAASNTGQQVLWVSLLGTCCLRPYPVQTSQDWASLTDRAALLVLFLYALLSGISIAGTNIGGAVWLQAIVAIYHLTMAMGLTLDEGKSRLSKVCRHPFVKFLGKLSMSVYLIHEVLIHYTAFIINGKQHWPSTKDFDNDTQKAQDFLDNRLIPLWAIPLVILASLASAVLLYYCVEQPMRKVLRSSRRTVE